MGKTNGRFDTNKCRNAWSPEALSVLGNLLLEVLGQETFDLVSNRMNDVWFWLVSSRSFYLFP